MKYGSDPFFGLPWGANKMAVAGRMNGVGSKVSNEGTWFDGIYTPPSDRHAVYRAPIGFDLDGVVFDATVFGFWKDRWIGAFHRLWFVRLEMFFRKKGFKRKSKKVYDVAGEVVERLSARYGKYESDGVAKCWFPKDGRIEVLVYQIQVGVPQDDIPNIQVVASPSDDRAREPRGF